MKSLSFLPLICTPLLHTSCTNVTLLGHVVAYDVNAEFKGDPVVPVGMNAGFESRSFAAVPPKNSVYWKANIFPEWVNGKPEYTLPKGDVLPTITKLKIQGIQDNNALNGVAFDFISSGATGDAAIAAAGGKAGPQLPAANAAKTNKLAAQVEEITNSPDSIRKPDTSVPSGITSP